VVIQKSAKSTTLRLLDLFSGVRIDLQAIPKEVDFLKHLDRFARLPPLLRFRHRRRHRALVLRKLVYPVTLLIIKSKRHSNVGLVLPDLFENFDDLLNGNFQQFL
jgi:hypothetical protein